MRRIVYLFIVLLALLLVIPLVMLADSRANPSLQTDFENSRNLLREHTESGADSPRNLNAQGSVNVMVELEAEPLALVYARSQATGSTRAQTAQTTQAQLATIESAQATAVAAIEQIDETAVELFSVQRAYNGIAMRLDAGSIDAVAKLPGVKSVQILATEEYQHQTSVPLLGAPEVWDSLGYDLTGDGIKIGVIDTGIDYLHTNFAGGGTDLLYAQNDTTIITDQPSVLYYGPSGASKVVGGWDFAGDDYDASGDDGSPVPSPDPDPMDCNGHGSHVAGTAAGFGVNPDGSTYVGGYDNVPISSMRIGPGMAPEAELYALRVFGCEGSTNLTTAAIDWALDPDGNGDMSDMLDIINMSLGSSYGSPTSASAVASDNAAAAGLIVVASAGNSGDTYYISGSPGISGRTLNVAGSVDAGSIRDGFRADSGVLDGDVFAASKGSAFDWTGFTAITDTLSYPITQSSGCAPFSPANQALISGTIALLNWTDGECGSGTRGDNLENAGAIGMLLADNSDLFDLSIFGSDLMPSYSIPFDVGETLSNTLGAEGVLTLTLSSEYDNSILYEQPQFTDTIYTSSSRGPRMGDSYLKPDITAVAVSVFSTAALTGDEGASFNGTSMASPHIAGMMALLKQQHPTWSVEELKALAMNNATFDIFTGEFRTGDVYGIGRVGSGRASAPHSAATDVVAFDALNEGFVSVSFGQVDVLSGTMESLSRQIEVVNKGAASVTYAVAYEPRVETDGVSYAVSAPTLSVGPGATEMITVTMMADGTAMGRGGADVTIAPTQGGLPRYWLGEAGGYVVLTPTTMVFTAELDGSQEVPPNASSVDGTATLTYTLNSTMDYVIEFDDTIDVTGAHIHSGLAGMNGGIIVNLNATAGTYGVGTPLAGTSSALTDAEDLQLLFTQGAYVNVHSPTYPAGEIRGQVQAWDSPLRVPVHTAPRLVSDMTAVQSAIDVGTAMSATRAITLTGTGFDGSNETSLVSAYELQIVSEDDPLINDVADVQYVGATSDIYWAGTITDTYVTFGISAYGDWTKSAVDGYFEIYLDTDEDGSVDVILFTSQVFGDNSDVFTIKVVDFVNPTFASSFLNVYDATVDTHPYNTNVVAMDVAAADLGLSVDNTDFDYFVVTYDPDTGDVADITDVAHFDAGAPGLDFTNSVYGPMHLDLDGETVDFVFNRLAFGANDSEGVLLLHHHNGDGNRAETLTIGAGTLFLPTVFRQ